MSMKLLAILTLFALSPTALLAQEIKIPQLSDCGPNYNLGKPVFHEPLPVQLEPARTDRSISK